MEMTHLLQGRKKDYSEHLKIKFIKVVNFYVIVTFNNVVLFGEIGDTCFLWRKILCYGETL